MEQLTHRNTVNIPLTPANNSTELDKFLTIFQDLNALSLPKSTALRNWYCLLDWNQHSLVFQPQQLQKLWMKLIKKYKFKLVEWEAFGIPTNIHAFMLEENGHGLQSLIRFYRDRKLTHWKENIFQFGLYKLIYESHFANLEMFFLAQTICENWSIKYEQLDAFKTYYNAPKHYKTKELFDAYTHYLNKSESGIRLYQYLTAYNPQFNIASKNTPIFYKELHMQIHNIY